MTSADLALVRDWLRQPHVSAWWGEDVEREIADLAGQLRAGGPSVCRIVERERHAVGLLYRYRIADYPEYGREFAAAGVPVPPRAWSMDYLLGAPESVGRGVGVAMVRAACAELWAEQPDAACVIVAVHADNERSWRALQRAGFTTLLGTVDMAPDVGGHDRRHVVSRLDRPN